MNEEYAVGSLSKILNKGDLPVDRNTNLVSLFSKSPKQEKLFVPVNPHEEPPVKNKIQKVSQEENASFNQHKRKRSADAESSEFVKIRTRKRKKQNWTDPEKNLCTIFVGNLPNSFSEKELKKLFRSFGKIESVRFRSAAATTPKLKEKLNKRIAVITKNFHDGRHNINAYVKFENEDSANKALIMNGTEIQGFHIRVDLSSNSKEHDSKKSVFLGNLPFDIEEDNIHSHFEDCGIIEGIRIIRDSETGLGKGFGYVLFRNEDSVQLALRLNNQTLQGRMLRVKRCVKKQKQNQNKDLQSKSSGKFIKDRVRQPNKKFNVSRNAVQRENDGHHSQFKRPKKDFRNPTKTFQGQSAKPFKKSKHKKFQKRKANKN